MKKLRSIYLILLVSFVLVSSSVMAEEEMSEPNSEVKVETQAESKEETKAEIKAETQAESKPDEALKKLAEGNTRYTESKSIHPDSSKERREEVAKGQHPFVVIVGCSDSRVSPEIVFDQGLGDIFVVRVAGNVVDDTALGSIEYAVEHLGAPLIVVLGHERCGAVDATIKSSEHSEHEAESQNHIVSLIKAIKPAVDKVKDSEGDKLENAIKSNVGMIVEQLKSSKPFLKEFAKEGKLKIVGAYYDLDSGEVTVLP